MNEVFRDDLTRQVIAAGLVISGNNALEAAARIVEKGKSPAQTAKEIRALKQQPPGSQPSEMDKFKEMEQAFMATKEELTNALEDTTAVIRGDIAGPAQVEGVLREADEALVKATT